MHLYESVPFWEIRKREKEKCNCWIRLIWWWGLVEVYEWCIIVDLLGNIYILNNIRGRFVGQNLGWKWKETWYTEYQFYLRVSFSPCTKGHGDEDQSKWYCIERIEFDEQIPWWIKFEQEHILISIKDRIRSRYI